MTRPYRRVTVWLVYFHQWEEHHPSPPVYLASVKRKAKGFIESRPEVARILERGGGRWKDGAHSLEFKLNKDEPSDSYSAHRVFIDGACEGIG